jgi:hypothetical protein
MSVDIVKVNGYLKIPIIIAHLADTPTVNDDFGTLYAMFITSKNHIYNGQSDIYSTVVLSQRTSL